MKLQHNYTTKEQALRLKAAGLPAETADCMLSRMDADYGINDLVTLISEKGEAGENWDYFMDEDAFPCWSLGRLASTLCRNRVTSSSRRSGERAPLMMMLLE